MWESKCEIQKKLERLYPGENSNEKYREYRLLQKKLAICLISLGLLASICSYLWRQANKEVFEEGGPLRREWGEGSYEVTLSAQIGEIQEEITYIVEERQYTDDELQYLLKQVTEALPEMIKGQNESLSCVRSNLILPTQPEGYPFLITWKSSNYKLLRSDGRINSEDLSKEGEEIVLTAVLSCQGRSFRQEFPVRLYPKIVDSQTATLIQLKRLIVESDERSKQENILLLPENLGENAIIWKKQISWQGGYFLLLGVLGGGAVIWGMNRDLTKKEEERKKELTACYPEFVSSLQLYLGAGLSLRNAFFKLGSDYCLQKQRDNNSQFLYEEVILACNRLANGVPEPEVYRKWAERCDEVHYRKLGYLLVSYGRQGNADILQQLGKEAYSAWEEHRQKSRKQGEEAGTKLLFPMALMLLVVMLLILMPVYVSI